MAQTLSFPNFPPERYAALCVALRDKGLHLDGNQGQIKEFGADVSYTYGFNLLTLKVESAPHFHSMDSFCAQMKAAVEGVKWQ